MSDPHCPDHPDAATIRYTVGRSRQTMLSCGMAHLGTDELCGWEALIVDGVTVEFHGTSEKS